jgi:hypothetical protein
MRKRRRIEITRFRRRTAFVQCERPEALAEKKTSHRTEPLRTQDIDPDQTERQPLITLGSLDLIDEGAPDTRSDCDDGKLS